MIAMVMADGSLLASLGQVAAIIICLFFFLLIIVMVAVNLLTAFLTAWLREKAELLKMLHPVVNSVVEAREEVQRGDPPDEDQAPMVRTVAMLPERLDKVNQKVEHATDRVMDTVIELRARTMQAKAVAKAFFLPGLVHRESTQRTRTGRRSYRRIMREASEAVSSAEAVPNIADERPRDVSTR